MKGIFSRLKGLFSRPKKISLDLENGDQVILIGMLSAPKSASVEAVTRNIFRVNPEGVRVWQVGEYPHGPVSTFTNIYWGEKGELLAFNFDCGEYQIDLESGKLISSRFLK